MPGTRYNDYRQFFPFKAPLQPLLKDVLTMALLVQGRGRVIFGTAVEETRRIYTKYFCLVPRAPRLYGLLGEVLKHINEVLVRFGENIRFGGTSAEIPTDTIDQTFAQLVGGLLDLLAELEGGLRHFGDGNQAHGRIEDSFQVVQDVAWVDDILEGLHYYARSVKVLVEAIQRLVSMLRDSR
jgi:hypothetical protein